MYNGLPVNANVGYSKHHSVSVAAHLDLHGVTLRNGGRETRLDQRLFTLERNVPQGSAKVTLSFSRPQTVVVQATAKNSSNPNLFVSQPERDPGLRHLIENSVENRAQGFMATLTICFADHAHRDP